MSLASSSLTHWRPPGTAGGRETKARSTCWSTLPPSSPCSPAKGGHISCLQSVPGIFDISFQLCFLYLLPATCSYTVLLN